MLSEPRARTEASIPRYEGSSLIWCGSAHEVSISAWLYSCEYRYKKCPEEALRENSADSIKEYLSPELAKYTSNNYTWRLAYLDRIMQILQQDKNHPSTII